jgi:DNA-directed RNA polymerase subunit M/transcription elongation factor TFIIS
MFANSNSDGNSNMKFCTVCDNVYFIKVNDDNDMVYYCKSCGNEDVVKKETGSICIIDDNKVDDSTKYSQYMNKYIKYDPTLPRVHNIPCTNAACTKKHDQKDEVIYLKYDPINMKFMYYCVHCEHFWKLSGQS